MQVVLQGFDAHLGSLMNPGAERHPRIYRDAETALGGRVVAPLRHQKKTPSHFHGLQQLARGLYPIPHHFLTLPVQEAEQ